MTSATTQPHDISISVPVRFAMVSEPEWLAEADTVVQTRLVVDGSYSGLADGEFIGDPVMSSTEAVHVALWGGPFEGSNVTYATTPLTPGSYMFAFLDREYGDVMQGWLDVRRTGDDILNMLNNWKNSIGEQKQWLAYDYEVNGRTEGSDPANFKSFRKQCRAFNRLERRIARAIKAELRARTNRQHQLRDFLRHAEILLMPGGDELFHPTTQPAFGDDDLAAVRAGHVVTKMVLVADYQDARWRLRRVNQLSADLRRWKEVLREEVERLERCKGLMLLTDHLYHHDYRFVENERRMEEVLGHIDRLNEHLGDLRERRVALAFVTGLFAPNEGFRPLDQGERELHRERAVLEIEKHRLDLLFDEASESSVKRALYERHRQRAYAAIEANDRQLEELSEARTALAEMTESTDVIHRVGHTRLLTTTFVGEYLPPRIRQAVERASLLTARLESTDKVFVPRMTSVATVNTTATSATSPGR